MTKQFSNYSDLITYTRASKGHALRPVRYGDELVTNGDGSSTDGWTKAYGSNTTLSASSGSLRATGNASGAYGVSQGLSLQVGKLYKVVATVDVDNASGGSGNLRISNTSSLGGTSTTIATTTGTHYFNFIATDATTYIGVVDTASAAGDYVEIDNISVKEVTFDESDGTLTLFEHPNNIPRVEYDADGNRLGLLVEEARTNLVTYSEDLSPLTKVNSPTITTDIATAPDGTETVDGIQDASGGAFRRVKMFQGSVTANSTHTGSLFVKKETSETNYGGVTLNFTGGTSKVCYGIIDAVNGTINAPSIGNTITATFTTTEVGDFWRFSITATDTGSNTQLEFGVYGTLSTNGTTVGSGAGSVRRIWGAQLETGSFPTSYIKNEGTSSGVTRSADVASIPVADFGYNQSEGTVFVEASMLSNSAGTGSLSQAFFCLHDGTSNNRFEIYSENTSGLTLKDRVAGVNNQVNVSSTVNLEASTKVAVAYEIAEASRGVANGGSVASTSATANNAYTQLLIGDTQNVDAELNGHIKSIKYYPRRLSDAQLVELTS